MSDQRAVKIFVDDWRGRGSEKSDAHLFWIALLRLLNISQPEKFIAFELPIDVDGHQCFIDAYISTTRVLIEQKSRGVDLDKPARQSDGKFLTPFEQAKRYADARAYSQRPRWIVTSNFDEIRIYDMDRRDDLTPVVIKFERLPHEFSRLNFLVDPDDENVNPALKISKQAGELVGLIYRSFERAPSTLPPITDGAQPRMACPPRADVAPQDHDWAGLINRLCVRLVFCLYAEDSAIFDRDQFTAYVRAASDRRAALTDLFSVLNTPIDRRDPNLRAELAAFPYVNGDLFASADPVPEFSRETDHWLLSGAKEFNWFGISPTIFGALFESTLNPLTRRSGGMHYTSIENIHRVIDPLFLDDLHEEFKSIRRKRKNRRRELEIFQFKLARLTFFDPACGSGNFLTETYLSIRRLENEIIRELYGLGAHCRIEVSIENFYGIEVNDFAVAVARTALWIAENQMMQETEMIIHESINFLPLTSAAHIVEGNALTIDWKKIVPRGVDYIIGNPPFVGFTYQSAAQKADLQSIFPNIKNLDYVACWFKRAADFMIDTPTRAAFVSTNSITQGELVGILWSKLFETVHIDFARRTFRWLSESEDMASVHCVVIGFSVAPNDRAKIIYDGDQKIIASNINAYLIDGPNYFVEKRTAPLCDVPPMIYGNKPSDGGNLIIDAEDYEDFIRREPRAEKYIRRYVGSREFINGKPRWCLWLVDATEDELRLPLIAERVERCRQTRLKSISKVIRKLAATPTLFESINQPADKNFIVVPRVSSSSRKYIPMGYLSPDVIVSNAVSIIPDGDLFHFGVLESVVHMAWMRVTCVRLKSDYNYSNTIVYNNFPWCAHSARIEETAQKILDARSLYPDWTLAALYDEEKMPVELRAAHRANDCAVLDAYGFARDMSEAEIVSRLMEIYRRLSKKID